MLRNRPHARRAFPRWFVRSSVGAATALGLALSLTAQQAPITPNGGLAAMDAVAATRGVIPWRSGPIATARKPVDELSKVLSAAVSSEIRHIVVQFERPVLESERAALLEAGLALHAYVHDNAYFASVASGADTAAIVGLGLLRDVLSIRTEWKLHADYPAGRIAPWSIVDAVIPEGESDTPPAVDPNPTVAAYVVFHPDVPLDGTALNAAWRHDATIVSSLKSINTLVVELPWSNIPLLAAEDVVQWIEPPLPPFSELNDNNRERVGANQAAAPPYSLDGAGVTVMVYDGGPILATHPDLTPRVITLDPETTNSNHATHVAGTIGGSGAASGGQYRGMAPAVTILSYEFENSDGSPLSQGFLYTNPGDLEANYTEAVVTHGADITNNSIGTNTAPNGYPCEWEGDYGVTDTLIDAIVRGSLGAPLRVVWANGNERQGTARCGSAYRTTAPPACAKNHVTIGAVNSNDDSMTDFSSWGPADDGRLKPDVCGPGCQSDPSPNNGVTSCSTSMTNVYTSLCGTSMACPTVTGLAALLLQDFRAQYPGEPDFRNSTLRALLAHTAVDLGNAGPDYQFGYGSVRVVPAIEQLRSGNFSEGTVSQGETALYLIIVDQGATELKVTLAWDDPPGTPNISPALINDLQLRVFDPASVRHYPWTLDPAAPANPAVQNADDTLNNIEQVFIANPGPGAYLLQVAGHAVAQGPQPFSIVVSPSLVECTSSGIIALDQPTYACSDTASVRVADCDLNTSDTVVDTVNISIVSTSEPTGETLLLTETDAASANFLATIPVSLTDAPGTLLVAAGDTVTATYIDANDGAGGTNVPVMVVATIDCQAPVVLDVQVSNIVPRGATITFTTNEPTNATVRRGDACGVLGSILSRPGYNTAHTFTLTGLLPGTTYYFAVDVLDGAGNATTDDNGGACYSFTTPDVPDFFTQQFSAALGAPDLAGTTILFTPNGTIDYYSACTTPACVLPTDPTGGTTIALTNTNALQVTVGAPGVQLYGATYQSFFVSSGGYLTFTATDTDSSETIAEHFDTPRISGLFDDLNPATAGQVSWKNAGDRIAVTYLGVAGATTEPTNTFQIEMYFDGRIQMTWLQIGSVDGIVGLSAGPPLDPDFAPSDLSEYAGCAPRPPAAAPASFVVATGRPATLTLSGCDDGEPAPPAALTYIVASLPQHGLRDAGNEHLILPGDLPYTLVNGGNQVRYQSTPGFVGPDSFQFRVNDGGSAPDGGASALATISVNVQPVLALPFVETFPSTTFDSSRWSLVSNATIDTLGLNPLSPPNSARFNGSPVGRDEIQSHLIDLGDVGIAELSYGWQCRGGGESPDANEDLFFEFLRADGAWQILRQYPGATTPDMTSFQVETLLLPAEALHSSFRLRVRNIATTGASDDWFVDDIRIVSLETPTATSALVNVPANTTSSINLDASDPNGDSLDYVIESLPINGDLLDPGTLTSIATVPYTLVGGGDIVRYRADLGYIGADSFTFRVTDGTNNSNIATLALDVGGRVLVHSFPLSENPNWATEGLWAYGAPTGGGTQNRDPLSGFTGPNVYGYNLNGNYENNLAAIRYLRTTAIDCSNLAATQLRFRRWLGIESAAFDHANIQASQNGTNWAAVWDHVGSGAISETAWSYQMYDIAAVADGQPTVYVRWGMGPTDAGTSYPGWNIDDVEIWAVLPPRLPGDANCDGAINFFDIDPFVVAVVDAPSYPILYPDCDLLSADTNRDGAANFFDIDPFLALLFP